ncbi:FAD-binding oxidoreductase [Haliangium ochraceum]|uniref:FAD linked oxidase domain protein n=1 Tax=Haliangium ochraceum (strain DSM 14365 / JCM 11303 / SMP-2) TaxID=502025 RepID=D0LRK9_HALO1|nr:FAD-binding oxidoreductase [Haliangium ochraceum]ACY19001.1 FAD linked oxidase domain protein [Haliangium ochraceum DSM 14365]
MSLPSEFLAVTKRDFPADFATDDPEMLATYGVDWTRVFTPAPSLVVRPRNTEEVARFISLCHEHGVAVVPSGGRTGLAGGAVAKDGEVVVSLERMRRIDSVDENGMSVRVEAGAITEAVHQHCAQLGLTWPVDFASKGSSQIGGNIATNAGGVKVIRYGLTRQWVLGLQVVTGTGEVLELGGALEKNNTGVDLRQLFIGSEGILGLVTEATLKLTRLPERLDVFLFALDDLAAVLALFRAARRAPFQVSAYEFFTSRCLARVRRHRAIDAPFHQPSPFYVLLEVEAHELDLLEDWLAGLFDDGIVRDGVLAQTTAQARALWELREAISESLAATGMPHKNDVALPIASLDAFCADLERVFADEYPTWEICLFGHIGDGNLHVNVMKPDDLDKDSFLARTHEADAHLFELVRSYRGSVSAEHGIGLLKRPWLGHTRSASEIALMRALKSALDPKGILNPGKVIG